MASDSLTSLRLLDYSDKELLAIVADNVGDDGWAKTADVRDTLGLPKDRGSQSVGVRLAWLKRYGIVEGGARKWRLTPIGEVFLNGQLPDAIKRQVGELEPGQLHAVTRLLARRQKRAAKPVGHMIRREWVYGTSAKPK